MEVAVISGQTTLDIAVQCYGSAEAVIELALLNRLCISDDLTPGQKLVFSAPLDRQVAAYYGGKGLIPATGLNEMASAPLPDGIGYRIIYRDIFNRDVARNVCTYEVAAVSGQTALDIAVQCYGSVEAVIELALLNGLCISDDLTPGQKLVLGAPLDRQVAAYYGGKGLIPATGLNEMASVLLPDGIGYWIIYRDIFNTRSNPTIIL